MIVVIQCAARKNPNAGYFATPKGDRVTFVARPSEAPSVKGGIYARPDDPAEVGTSFREELEAYNKSGLNPLGLLPAVELYANDSYRRLADHYGVEKTYILSAGWGLIAATYLTPYYDITFSPMAESYKRRRKNERYLDLCMLPSELDESIVFFGGKDYLPLFCSLTKNVQSPRIIFYNAKDVPDAINCRLVRFQTTTKTNWHYECVEAVLSGRVSI